MPGLSTMKSLPWRIDLDAERRALVRDRRRSRRAGSTGSSRISRSLRASFACGIPLRERVGEVGLLRVEGRPARRRRDGGIDLAVDVAVVQADGGETQPRWTLTRRSGLLRACRPPGQRPRPCARRSRDDRRFQEPAAVVADAVHAVLTHPRTGAREDACYQHSPERHRAAVGREPSTVNGQRSTVNG